MGFLIASVLLISIAVGQIPTTPPPQNDPFVGTWQEKRAKKSGYVRTITRDGEELVFSSQGNPSKPKEHNYRIRCDGLFHPVPFGSISCKYESPKIVIGESRNTGKPPIYWKREVSTDGQEMIIHGYTDRGRETELGTASVLYRMK
jgi:hypothetical protein